MQSWLNFWTLFFWLTLVGFLFNPSSFLSLVFYSELSWLTLYTLSILTGAINDDMNLISLTFFILGLAGLEFSFAFLLLILFKSFNVSLFFIEEDKKLNSYTLNNKNFIKIQSFLWLK